MIPNKTRISVKYDLEERTYIFAQNINRFLKITPKTLPNIEYSKQLIRSAASIGANYIEANEALSKKDFIMRIKIARKEAKESVFWLRLIENENATYNQSQAQLATEATELMKIFGAILRKSE